MPMTTYGVCPAAYASTKHKLYYRYAFLRGELGAEHVKLDDREGQTNLLGKKGCKIMLFYGVKLDQEILWNILVCNQIVIAYPLFVCQFQWLFLSYLLNPGIIQILILKYHQPLLR